MSNRGRHKSSIITKYRRYNSLGKLSKLSDKILLEILEERKRQGECEDFGSLPWNIAANSTGNEFDWINSEKGFNYWDTIFKKL